MRFYTVGFRWIYLLSSPVLLLTTLLPEIQDSGKLVHQPHLQFDLNRVPVDDSSKEIPPWSFQPSSSLAASSPDLTSQKDQAALRSPANIQKPIPSKDDIKSSRHKRKNELSSKPDGKSCRNKYKKNAFKVQKKSRKHKGKRPAINNKNGEFNRISEL
ncbi:hypothetical protein PGTUg99_012576 [Puccinia graminis f. sp. tritici]|uniref:Uncharacterized protein n=1 Tax=Puccinia graminis f. sp. tritici TaxID=56615 RepID=A0A5B0S3V2_PUCGR|nr:hypothetical protein PGTUg99_012576 [Puccinia graminis f. sp. tritici]